MLNNTTNTSLLVGTLKERALKTSNGYKFKGLGAKDFSEAHNPNFSLYRDAVEVYRVQMFNYSNGLCELSNRDLDSTMKRALSLWGLTKEERDALCKKVGDHKYFVAKRYGQSLTEEGRAMIEEVRNDYANKFDELNESYRTKYTAELHQYGVINETELDGENAVNFAKFKEELSEQMQDEKTALEKEQSMKEKEIRDGSVWTPEAFKAVSPSVFRRQFEHAVANIMCDIALAEKIEEVEFYSAEQWGELIERAKKEGVKMPKIQKMKDTKNYSGLQAEIRNAQEERKAKKEASLKKAGKSVK